MSFSSFFSTGLDSFATARSASSSLYSPTEVTKEKGFSVAILPCVTVLIRPSESVYVVKGKIVSKVYDLDKNLICEVVLNKGEIIVQYEGIHEYSILENALVLENKNGPYFGPDKDRTRVEIE